MFYLEFVGQGQTGMRGSTGIYPRAGGSDPIGRVLPPRLCNDFHQFANRIPLPLQS